MSKRPYKLWHFSADSFTYGTFWSSYSTPEAARKAIEKFEADPHLSKHRYFYSGWFQITGPEFETETIGVGNKKDVPFPTITLHDTWSQR